MFLSVIFCSGRSLNSSNRRITLLALYKLISPSMYLSPVVTSSTLEGDYEGFIKYLEAKEIEATTALAYRDDVKRFKTWLEATWPELTWHGLSPLQLNFYLDSFKGPDYHNRVMNSLRHWFDYLEKEKGFKGTNPARELSRKPSKVHPFKYLTLDEVKRLIQTAYQCSRKTERHRNTSLIAFMYGTGLRVSEVCAFKLEDVRFRAEQPHAITVGGGKRQRLVMLSRSAKEALGFWLTWSREQFGIHPEEYGGYIWVAVTKKANTKRRGTPLDPQAIRPMLERYGRLAGIEQKVTPKVLRNTFDHELRMAKVRQEVIGALLSYQQVELNPASPFESREGVLEKAVALLPDVWWEGLLRESPDDW